MPDPSYSLFRLKMAIGLADQAIIRCVMSMEAASKLLNRLEKVLWLVTSQSELGQGGLIATFVQNVSLVPDRPRVLLAIANHHHTFRIIEQSRRLGLHLLGKRNIDLVWRFGMRSGQKVDKFAGLTTNSGVTGVPILPGTVASFECAVENRMDTGDRCVYLAQVTAARIELDESPMTGNELLELATPEKRAELEEQQTRDIEIDRVAIDQWRKSRLPNI